MFSERKKEGEEEARKREREKIEKHTAVVTRERPCACVFLTTGTFMSFGFLLKLNDFNFFH